MARTIHTDPHRVRPTFVTPAGWVSKDRTRWAVSATSEEVQSCPTAKRIWRAGQYLRRNFVRRTPKFLGSFPWWLNATIWSNLFPLHTESFTTLSQSRQTERLMHSLAK